jgi:hypothetical protein
MLRLWTLEWNLCVYVTYIFPVIRLIVTQVHTEIRKNVPSLA